MAHSLVLGRAQDVPAQIRVPRQAVAASGKSAHTIISFARPKYRTSTLKPMTYPSLVCPLSTISGLVSAFSAGTLACLVRSNTYTSPITVFVAIRSGFCGMYRALLTSPVCGIDWITLMRGLAAV